MRVAMIVVRIRVEGVQKRHATDKFSAFFHYSRALGNQIVGVKNMLDCVEAEDVIKVAQSGGKRFFQINFHQIRSFAEVVAKVQIGRAILLEKAIIA